MELRFSIKWLLGAMVYCAIAAVALTQTNWHFSVILWLATFFAFVYAALLACYVRGARQARVVGFAVGSGCLCLCLYAAPDNVPTQPIVAALIVPQSQIVYAQPAIPPTPAVAATSTLNSYYAAAGYYPPPLPARPVSVTYQSPEDAALKLRALNTIATMLAGVVGAILGAIAFHRARPANGSPAHA